LIYVFSHNTPTLHTETHTDNPQNKPNHYHGKLANVHQFPAATNPMTCTKSHSQKATMAI